MRCMTHPPRAHRITRDLGWRAAVNESDSPCARRRTVLYRGRPRVPANPGLPRGIPLAHLEVSPCVCWRRGSTLGRRPEATSLSWATSSGRRRAGRVGGPAISGALLVAARAGHAAFQAAIPGFLSTALGSFKWLQVLRSQFWSFVEVTNRVSSIGRFSMNSSRSWLRHGRARFGTRLAGRVRLLARAEGAAGPPCPGAPVARSRRATAAAQPPAEAPSDAPQAQGNEPAIYFDFDSYTAALRRALDVLQKVAGTLQGQDTPPCEIDGNCDELGTTEYNLALGEERAKAAKSYLRAPGRPQRQGPGRSATAPSGPSTRVTTTTRTPRTAATI